MLSTAHPSTSIRNGFVILGFCTIFQNFHFIFLFYFAEMFVVDCVCFRLAFRTLLMFYMLWWTPSACTWISNILSSVQRYILVSIWRPTVWHKQLASGVIYSQLQCLWKLSFYKKSSVYNRNTICNKEMGFLSSPCSQSMNCMPSLMMLQELHGVCTHVARVATAFGISKEKVYEACRAN